MSSAIKELFPFFLVDILIDNKIWHEIRIDNSRNSDVPM